MHNRPQWFDAGLYRDVGSNAAPLRQSVGRVLRAILAALGSAVDVEL